MEKKIHFEEFYELVEDRFVVFGLNTFRVKSIFSQSRFVSASVTGRIYLCLLRFVGMLVAFADRIGCLTFLFLTEKKEAFTTGLQSAVGYFHSGYTRP